MPSSVQDRCLVLFCLSQGSGEILMVPVHSSAINSLVKEGYEGYTAVARLTPALDIRNTHLPVMYGNGSECEPSPNLNQSAWSQRLREYKATREITSSVIIECQD